jgi:hypothetical protein
MPATQPNHGLERDPKDLKPESRVAISTGGRHQMEVFQLISSLESPERGTVVHRTAPLIGF